MHVTLYGKPGCLLCDECKAELQTLREEFGIALEERNILDDPEAAARFQFLIPVVDVGSGPLLYPPHSRRTLWSALHAAQVQEELARGATAG